MIASLSMYDRPETAEANDRLWGLIRKNLGHGPEKLRRGGDPWDDWRSPQLLISQTCGLPFRMGLHEHVHLIGTPDHQLADCPPGYYRSAMIANAKDARSDVREFDNAQMAFNGFDSQSGWAAPAALATKLGLKFHPSFESGAHVASAKTVAEGRAELAALDAVTWEMIQEWDDFADQLKVVGWSDPTPALPYITADADLVEPLRDAFGSAISQLSQSDKRTLRLFGLVEIPASDYLALPLPPVH